MDIKNLNQSQLLLLAILLSFVISIATGITTVTLMEQAPSSVTTPINRVVRQTVERIQQVEGKTTTIVVKEEDLVVDAIEKNQSAVFVVTREFFDRDQDAMVEASAGRGFLVSENIIVTDAALVSQGDEYLITNAGGKFETDFLEKNEAGFSLLRITESVDGQNELDATLPAFGDLSAMKVGQKIIVFGASLSSVILDGSKTISLDVTPSNGGAIVLNLEGQVLGIALSGPTSFIPVADIEAAAEQYKGN